MFGWFNVFLLEEGDPAAYSLTAQFHGEVRHSSGTAAAACHLI